MECENAGQLRPFPLLKLDRLMAKGTINHLCPGQCMGLAVLWSTLFYTQGKAMAYSYLSGMGDHTEDWMIKVRVCRMWESINTKDNSLISVDMILIDEKGNLMHAAVRKHLVPRFGHRVSEGLVYSMRNFKVATNIYPYRPLASNLKLLFLATTTVQALEEGTVQIPRHGFEFVDKAVLQSRANDPTILSDVVGCFSGFNGVETVRGGFKKRDIQILTDYSVNSTITLWGKLGELFDPSLYTRGGGPYVIVVSSVTVRPFQGSLTFSTTSASKIYINPEVDHVSSIKERFSALSIEVRAVEGPPVAKLSPEEEMFINRMSVGALVEATNAGEMQATIVTLKAKITGINNGQGWHYISCKSCVRKVVPNDGVYVCNTCGPVDYPLALFRIKVEVQDGTGTTTVVLFNTAAERLLDTSAKKLFNKMPPGDYSAPPELETLLGKELVFKLKLNNYNFVEGLQDYRVTAVFTPVEKLESAYAGRDPAQEAGVLPVPPPNGGAVVEGGTKKRKLSPPAEDAGEGPSGSCGQ